MIHVGFDAKRAFLNNRGLGNYSRNLIEGLLLYTENISPILYTPSAHLAPKITFNLPSSVKIVTPESYLARLFPNLWRSLFLTKTLESSSLDIYHGLGHELPPYIEKLPLKKVLTVHDLIFMRFPKLFPLVDRKVYYQKLIRSCESADVILAICEQTKNDLIEFLNISEKKIQVHYQSCNPIFYNPPDKKQSSEILKKYHLERPYILNVGALEERKNGKNLIKAFHSLKDNFSGDLVFVGNGKKYKQEMEDLIKKNNLEHRVHILSQVPLEDLPSLYHRALLFCYPSFFEGFGIPIIESLFSQTPVITSHGSCFPESAKEGALYIDPYSYEDLALNIKKLLDSGELREKLAFQGNQYVKKTFHLENTTYYLTNLYSSLIDT